MCKNPPHRFDGSQLVQKALSGMIRTSETIGMPVLIDLLRGSLREELRNKGLDRLKTFGAGRDLSYKAWKEYLSQMLQLGYMEIDYINENKLKSTEFGRRVLYG